MNDNFKPFPKPGDIVDVPLFEGPCPDCGEVSSVMPNETHDKYEKCGHIINREERRKAVIQAIKDRNW